MTPVTVWIQCSKEAGSVNLNAVVLQDAPNAAQKASSCATPAHLPPFQPGQKTLAALIRYRQHSSYIARNAYELNCILRQYFASLSSGDCSGSPTRLAYDNHCDPANKDDHPGMIGLNPGYAIYKSQY
jgi:hypothetical protein